MSIKSKQCTPIHRIDHLLDNEIWMKRDDFIPFSFGGNKARKAALFFEVIDAGQYDCVVTYGSSSSNHCRIISNQCAKRGIGCHIISPKENHKPTNNSLMMELFGAELIFSELDQVSRTIETVMERLKQQGKKPYFIQGGGHGNPGTQAYVQCYEEIRAFEREQKMFFDYIFFASGTGTTQAGLVYGQLQHNEQRNIVGISIARKNPRGREVVIDSICEFDPTIDAERVKRHVIFEDRYIHAGYGSADDEIRAVVKEMLVRYGIPLDTTYTGKAFCGMKQYITEHAIKGKNILFIHTGGTPLFFDSLQEIFVSDRV
ncbi:MAG: pyridoxal-phosphate dependent enzyme [Eubacteriales bacterium]|nr:pyridoxal-phosphate dependent enzyme [Eubacteriales bacterium]